MAQTTTQSKHPYRAVIRTLFQVVVGFGVGFPIAVGLFGSSWQGGQLATYITFGLTASASITRLMASPKVEELLRQFAPWLAAAKIEADETAAANEAAALIDIARPAAFGWPDSPAAKAAAQPSPTATWISELGNALTGLPPSVPNLSDLPPNLSGVGDVTPEEPAP